MEKWLLKVAKSMPVMIAVNVVTLILTVVMLVFDLVQVLRGFQPIAYGILAAVNALIVLYITSVVWTRIRKLDVFAAKLKEAEAKRDFAVLMLEKLKTAQGIVMQTERPSDDDDDSTRH